MEIVVEKANISDAEEILSLQKLAYRSEAENYDDFTIEPLTQSLHDIEEQFNTYVFLKIIVDEMIVGSVRGQLIDGTCHIGKLFVHPNYQNKGLGKKLMAAMESSFDTPLRNELFTGNKSEKNIQLYKKAGYEIFRTKSINAQLSLVFMEKH